MNPYKLNLGIINYWLGRVLSLGGRIVQPINFMILAYLAFSDNLIILLLVPIIIFLVSVWIVFDSKSVLEDELNYHFMKTPVIRQMSADIKFIKEKMK